MPRALKIILIAEVLLGVLWTLLAAMAHGAGGLAVFGLFLIVYALFAVFFLVALYALALVLVVAAGGIIFRENKAATPRLDLAQEADHNEP